MAKVSMRQRELKRTKTVAKYAVKHAELKAIILDPSISEEERWEAQKNSRSYHVMQVLHVNVTVVV